VEVKKHKREENKPLRPSQAASGVQNLFGSQLSNEEKIVKM
jgi:hypothetical protein